MEADCKIIKLAAGAALASAAVKARARLPRTTILPASLSSNDATFWMPSKLLTILDILAQTKEFIHERLLDYKTVKKIDSEYIVNRQFVVNWCDDKSYSCAQRRETRIIPYPVDCNRIQFRGIPDNSNEVDLDTLWTPCNHFRTLTFRIALCAPLMHFRVYLILVVMI
ncbi:hypothetical protein GJ496_000818 [Pomphorhynchus laevis]|nr:hypothetical protein GJ496_000818 [Pomphorhynchus laevis]